MIFCICRGLSLEHCEAIGLEGLKDGQVCGACVREIENENKKQHSESLGIATSEEPGST